ncbi:MAG: ABC transporter permease subunit [Gemmataceae bacterium]
MSLLRLLITAALAVGLLAPVLVPAARTVGGSAVWREAGRIAELAATTAQLAGLAVLLAVPLGTLLAVALERVSLPGRGFFRLLVLAGLFVPLPVAAVAWQTVFGQWLPPLRLAPGQVAWRPWSLGLLPAAWVHAAAGLPWVIWVVSAGLRTGDRGLEEDALLTGGPGAVVRWVVLPRAAVAAVAAGGWVAVQAVTEIPATDAMMVRTFAEEVYTRFVAGEDGFAAAVAVTVPAWGVALVLAGWLATWAVRRFGPPPEAAGEPGDIPVSPRTRWLAAAGVWAAALVFAGLPLAALAWKAGSVETVRTAWVVHWRVLVGSVGTAATAGLLAAGLTWVACWQATGSRWFARLLFVACVVLWVTPGPVVGFGLLDTIRGLVRVEGDALNRLGVSVAFPPLASALYDQPSPVPTVWAAVVRFFPVAVAVLWPAVRAVPRELLDLAKLDGVSEWRLVVAPLTGPAFVRAGVAVAALALGEVSSTKIVVPPGREEFVLRVFDQMHYGSESSVAALCLLQIAATTAVAGLLVRRA